MKNFLILMLAIASFGSLFGQASYNPYVGNIHFNPEPIVAGINCGVNTSVIFNFGLNGNSNTTQWTSQPLKLYIGIQGFKFLGSPTTIVSGSFSSKFNWNYEVYTLPYWPFYDSVLIGTQNQSFISSGNSICSPHPSSFGEIVLSLNVPNNLPISSALWLNVNIIVPSYMSASNLFNDDNESIATQSYCTTCIPFIDGGTIDGNQTIFTGTVPTTLNSIVPTPSNTTYFTARYQWQKLVSGVWVDVDEARAVVYSPPILTDTTTFRRNMKPDGCGTWVSSNPITVNVTPTCPIALPIADAGFNKYLTCTQPSIDIGTPAISGYTYDWQPTWGLNDNSIAMPTAILTLVNPMNYTVTVTNSYGCTSTDVVEVQSIMPFGSSAGGNKYINCGNSSVYLGNLSAHFPSPPGTASYLWTPSIGLSSPNSQFTFASPTFTRTYTLTVTNNNGCSVKDRVTVFVDNQMPSACAGYDDIINCLNQALVIGTPPTNGYTYSWNPTIGLSQLNGLPCNAPGCPQAQLLASPLNTTTYTLTVSSSNGCTATDVVTVIKDPNSNCQSTLNVKCYIEAYWNGINEMRPVLALQGVNSNLNICDSITVELRNPNSPYNTLHSTKVILNTDGTASCIFPSLSNSYYVVIKHRNAVETWSALPITIGATPVNYDFTTSASTAFGNNQKEIATGKWALFSGDLNHDENFDLDDLVVLELNINQFLFGFVDSDLNGDGNVDLLDRPILEFNSSNFVFSNHP